MIGYSITLLSVIHIVAHYFNYLNLSLASNSKISPLNLAFATGPGLTGQIASVALFLMVTAAVARMRRKHFNVFWFAHHLFVLVVAALIMHGLFITR
jgi:NADPH oxidase 2